MKSKKKGNPTDWSASRRHLARDPMLRKLMGAVGPCPLQPRGDHFLLLCKAIYSQQISTRVAAVLFKRFGECFPKNRPTPALVKKLLTGKDDARLKSCGLSRQKRQYLIDLAEHFLDNRIPNRRLGSMSDDEIIEALVAVNGIGRWTAEMFLIFALNRPDVWPADDFGLQVAVQKAFNLPERPKAKQVKELGEKWKPHRTAATWYLWRSLELAKKKIKAGKPT